MDVLLISPPGSTAERLYSMNEIGGLTAVLRHGGFYTEILDRDDFVMNPMGVVEVFSKTQPILRVKNIGQKMN